MFDEIDPKVQLAMNKISLSLDIAFNGDNVMREGHRRSVGFMLLVYPWHFAKGERVNWISNAPDSTDFPALLRYMADRFERGE